MPEDMAALAQALGLGADDEAAFDGEYEAYDGDFEDHTDHTDHTDDED
jgi:hypothetical protein